MAIEKTTKNDLIEHIYSKSSLDKQNIACVVDLFLEEMKLSLESGSVIELRGFGTFEPRLRNGRKVARNPKTGQTLKVDPHYVAAFRAGRDLRMNLLKLPVTKDEE